MDAHKSPSTFSALLNCKCPRCKKGEIFKQSAFSFTHYREMYKECSNCHLRYELEVGFFWGAMYIGYALNVAISVMLGVATYILADNPDTWIYMTSIIAGILLTYRFNFRYARVILLYLFAPSFKDEKITENHIHTNSDPKQN